MDLTVVYRKTADLVPYCNNSRVHSQEQVEQIAASIEAFGFCAPVLTDSDGGIIAGHGRVMAAMYLGRPFVPTLPLHHLSDEQRRAYVIADNQLALTAEWDLGKLRDEVSRLLGGGFDTDVLGFEAGFLDDLLADVDEAELTGEDNPGEVREGPVITRPGDVWVCGPHRVMCGDSTSVDDVARLMAGARADLLHADPPYGMGKRIANDNLRRERLDAFQLQWWATARPFVAPNASAYIWGNAPDLWRLWYAAGLSQSEEMHLQNEVVWDKETTPGMRSAGMRGYPVATERALFFQLGDQYLENVNQDAFPEAWRPLLEYMRGEAQAAGITPEDVRRVTGKKDMFLRWFSPSQFSRMPEPHYAAFQAAYPGRFLRPWADINAEWQQVKRAAREAFEDSGTRCHFDNTHDAMTDVWRFPRVSGQDRHGHDTPKPVAMMERAVRSSCPPGGVVLEPFGGTGPVLLAAERSGRICRIMELDPGHCDTIVNRWRSHTGEDPVHEQTGRPWSEFVAAAARRALSDEQ